MRCDQPSHWPCRLIIKWTKTCHDFPLSSNTLILNMYKPRCIKWLSPKFCYQMLITMGTGQQIYVYLRLYYTFLNITPKYKHSYSSYWYLPLAGLKPATIEIRVARLLSLQIDIEYIHNFNNMNQSQKIRFHHIISYFT